MHSKIVTNRVSQSQIFENERQSPNNDEIFHASSDAAKDSKDFQFSKIHNTTIKAGDADTNPEYNDKELE